MVTIDKKDNNALLTKLSTINIIAVQLNKRAYDMTQNIIVIECAGEPFKVDEVIHPEWLKVDQIPKRNFFCVFIEEEYKHDEIDIANIGDGGIGFPHWDRKLESWTIEENGEALFPGQILAICEIPDPRVLNKCN